MAGSEIHDAPRVSVIIPSRNRPERLERAVSSVLAQTFEDFEIIVVDDASSPPVRLAQQDPRIRIIRLDENVGSAAARTHGAREARGHFVTSLDDDDVYLPGLLEKSLEAWKNDGLDGPVGVISALEVRDEAGILLDTRTPPLLRRKGCHFSLEQQDPGCSYFSKQTLLVEKTVLAAIGYWHEHPPSRNLTDLFLRLNPVCHIVGIPDVTYRLTEHDEYRISKDPSLRQAGFDALCEKHRDIMLSKPKGLAVFQMEHVENSLIERQYLSAFKTALKAMRNAPVLALRRAPGISRRAIRRWHRGRGL